MPGLSQYRPQYAPPDENGIYHEDPLQTGEWTDEPTAADYAAAKQQAIDEPGFANPARSLGDRVFHGLYNNVPRGQYDAPISYTDNNDREYEMTLEELMNLVKRLSPLDPRGPLYEHQTP